MVKPVKPIQGDIFSIDERLNSRVITNRIDANMHIGYRGIIDCNLTGMTQSVALRSGDSWITIDGRSGPHTNPPVHKFRMSRLAIIMRIWNEIEERSHDKPCSHGSSRLLTSLTRYPSKVGE